MSLEHPELSQSGYAEYQEAKRFGNGRSTFLSGLAVAIASLALLCSGYTAYQLFSLQKTLATANAAPQNVTTAADTAAKSPAPKPVGAVLSTTTKPLSSTKTKASASKPESAPKAAKPKFVQSAFDGKGEVELLSVTRTTDPDTGLDNLVNVRMQIRRLAEDDVNGSDVISVVNTTARQPGNSEVYSVANDRSTGMVSLFSIPPKVTVGAHLWLKVPDDVNSIDIIVPSVGTFKNVPIK